MALLETGQQFAFPEDHELAFLVLDLNFGPDHPLEQNGVAFFNQQGANLTVL